MIQRVGSSRRIVSIIRRLIPAIKKQKAALFVNVGDHADVWQELLREIPEMQPMLHTHFDDFAEASAFCTQAYSGDVTGLHAFCHKDIFAAVYSTNLLMRVSDMLITKPSELSFYPIPKLMIHRVGGHEAWGAIRSAEIGDGTYECSTPSETAAMLLLLQKNGDIIEQMCGNILAAHRAGIYDGAYKTVQLAADQKLNQ